MRLEALRQFLPRGMQDIVVHIMPLQCMQDTLRTYQCTMLSVASLKLIEHVLLKMSQYL
jgi:hypothetical protein